MITTQKKPSGISTAIKAFLQETEVNNNVNSPLENKNLSIKVANNLEEREAAFRLGYEVYLEKNYIDKNKQEWLVQDYDFVTDTTILIVQDQNKQVLGTVTLVFDSESSLPCKQLYPKEVKFLYSQGAKLTELSRLAIARDSRYSKEILLLLINYLMIYSQINKTCNGLIIQVNPRHVAYYQKLLDFTIIGEEKSCRRVKDAPAVLLHLCFKRYDQLREKIAKEGKKTKIRSLYHQFLDRNYEPMVAEYLSQQATRITLEERLYFSQSIKEVFVSK